MSSPADTAPATSPESDAGVSILPPMLQAPAPENDQITPPQTPMLVPSQPPTLPIVVENSPPPPFFVPTLSPILQSPPQRQPEPPQSQPQPPQSQPQPHPQPQPKPPLTSPSNTPQSVMSPQVSAPIDINNTPPPTSTDTNTNTNTNPIIPPSPPSPPPSSRRPKTRPITKPSPIKQSPSSLKTNPTTTKQTPASPLPTSAVLPASPPVALPVPQTPTGGAWIPFSTESPTPLPILPGPSGTLSTPAGDPQGTLQGSTVTSASSSAGDHTNLATAVAPKGANNGANGFIVGLAVGGILLLLLATVFGVLVVFCKRRDKKKVGDNEYGSKHTTLYTEFKEKNSLPQYTKQGSNNTLLGHNTMIYNVSTSKGPSMATNGTHPMTVGPTLHSVPSFLSGSFTFEELSRATDGLSEHNLLGQGGFGYVYKGVLANGKEVAVKQLKMGGPQGEREFRAEVETISQVHHKHLVSLVGYCIAGAERLLVYEFVPNNTLEFHLHGNGQPVMDWPTRLKIAIGSAKGFAYLHEDCSPTIIHRDIKAANILLDFNFEAKVSDFGLAKIFSSTNPSATHITTRVVGTFGYLAPEYASSGKVTDKSDAYSYGVMLLELITGRPPISNFESSTSESLVNWARPLLAQAIGNGKFDSLADPKLQNDYNVDEMASMVACAAACVRLSAWRRPRMSQVVRALEGNLPPSELDDGTRPGQSVDFDARNYMEDLKRMVLTSNNGHTTTSRYSENTSEYGLNLSASSTETSFLSNTRG